MWATALLVLASMALESEASAPRPREIACLGASSIVGVSDRFDVIVFDGARWVKAPISQSVGETWRTPDGSLVGWVDRSNVVAISPSWGVSRWRLPAGKVPSFAMLGGMVAVTGDRIYSLEGSGIARDIAPTPGNAFDRMSQHGPVLVQAGESPLACYGTSILEADAVRGHCLREGPHPYHYAVDFGYGGSVLGEAAEATPPFACGDVVVSNWKGSAQARRLSDGVLVGRRNVFARRGSACLPDGRALIVGRREVAIFDLPAFRPRWRRRLTSKVKSAVLCGGRFAVLLEMSDIPMMIDPPAS